MNYYSKIKELLVEGSLSSKRTKRVSNAYNKLKKGYPLGTENVPSKEHIDKAKQMNFHKTASSRKQAGKRKGRPTMDAEYMDSRG